MDFSEVLQFWFGELDENGRPDAAHSARWWKKDAAFDQEIRDEFGATYQAVCAGECDAWLDSARGRLAFIIVLDQFSRNMFRGDAKTYAADELALNKAVEGVERGMDRELAQHERSFLYMPLMHSEDVEAQDRCVALFTAWRDEVPDDQKERVAGLLKYALAHRDIVARFGRFPHRNEMLGRASTPEEIEFLKQPGSSF